MAEPTSIKAPLEVVKEIEIEKLNNKNRNIYLGASGISLLGNIGGLVYAIQTKKSGWGKVGWFFLGGIVLAIPSAIVANSMITKNDAKIKLLEVDVETKSIEQKASDHCEEIYETEGAEAYNKCRKKYISKH